ncbi:hypothetical protein BGW80DRAFT_1400916 [Lactifluus volemus]|nr:hypothetical protein BGW80DRAFT_1400916 [Lactifluus volemus]
MRNKGKEEEVQRSVDWEKIWSHSPKGDVLPLTLQGASLLPLVPLRKEVHTIITLTDNAPQGLNKLLSSFPHATKVHSPLAFLALPRPS